MKRALAVLVLLACGHRAPAVAPHNEVAARADAAAADGEAEDECLDWPAHCDCEARRAELEIDAGVSCQDECIAEKVASGMSEGDADSDCIEDCICGE